MGIGFTPNPTLGYACTSMVFDFEFVPQLFDADRVKVAVPVNPA
jgi:hypothetical protein